MTSSYWTALALSAAVIGTALVVTAEPADARKRGAAQVRGFTQSEIDRRPIRETRPDNAGHYIYQNYPLWAARAFQPVVTR